mmetsp:Transcript_124214/g.347852  ORF Transcript_124214/g.347852 Transcript_124214/m.347852 type:complete len:338 (-) Transcript_124214:2-1015(-)
MLLHVLLLLRAVLVRLHHEAVPDADEAPAPRKDQDLGRVQRLRHLRAVEELQGERPDNDDQVQEVERLLQELPTLDVEQGQELDQERRQHGHGDEEAGVVHDVHRLPFVLVAPGHRPLEWGETRGADVVVPVHAVAPQPPFEDGTLQALGPRSGAAVHRVPDDEVAGGEVRLQEELHGHCRDINHQQDTEDQLDGAAVDEVDGPRLPRVLAIALLDHVRLVRGAQKGRILVHVRGREGLGPAGDRRKLLGQLLRLLADLVHHRGAPAVEPHAHVARRRLRRRTRHVAHLDRTALIDGLHIRGRHGSSRAPPRAQSAMDRGAHTPSAPRARAARGAAT